MHEEVNSHHQGNLKANENVTLLYRPNSSVVKIKPSVLRSSLYHSMLIFLRARRVKSDIYCNAHCTDEETETQKIVPTFSLNRWGDSSPGRGKDLPWPHSRLGGQSRSRTSGSTFLKLSLLLFQGRLSLNLDYLGRQRRVILIVPPPPSHLWVKQ